MRTSPMTATEGTLPTFEDSRIAREAAHLSRDHLDSAGHDDALPDNSR